MMPSPHASVWGALSLRGGSRSVASVAERSGVLDTDLASSDLAQAGSSKDMASRASQRVARSEVSASFLPVSASILRMR